MRSIILEGFIVVLLVSSCQQKPDSNASPDSPASVPETEIALPSWSEVHRNRLITWMNVITDSSGSQFIPVADRIAVFDNDGTLWPEQPIPNQLAYAIDFVRVQSSVHPEWQKDPSLKAYLEGDAAAMKKAGKIGLLKVMDASHTGLTETEFLNHVSHWMDTATDNRFHKRYKDLVYQPMLELMDYLRKFGFRTFIVSGGGADYMRAWTEEVYGIPPYQVVGSYGEARFELKDSLPVIKKIQGDYYFDDKEAKPVAIHRFIGKVPVFCGGNSDGDLAMMQYTAGSKYSNINVLIHHTDSLREYQYDLKTVSGHLEKALVEARARGWLVVDMKNDFKRIFPFEK